MRARPILALASIALAGCGAAPPPVAPAAISPPATTKAAADDAPAAALSALPDARAGGAVALARTPDGRTLAFVADEDGRALVTFDLDRGAVVAETPLDGAPAQVLVLARGGVAVTLRDASAVVLLAAQRGADAPLVERARRAVAADAFGLATSPDGARLLVTSGAGSRLAILGARDLDLEAEITLAREPRAVVVEPTGKRAFVSHAVGARLSSIDLDARAVSTIDLTTRTANRWGEPTRRTGDQGFALAWAAWSARPGAPAHGRLFAPAASVEPGEGVFTTAVYGAANGAPVLPVVHVVDPARGVTIGREIALPTSGAPGDRCNLPRAAAVASASLFVACLGLDAVLELDARAVDPAEVELRRVPVPSGPTGIAVDEARGRLVVWSAFAHALSVVDLRTSGPSKPLAIIAAPPRAGWATGALARGRALFHASADARITGDGRACASCHVDGRSDGLVWATPSGHRKTPVLAGRLEGSAPFGWTGARATLAGHIRDTWKRLGGAGAWSPADAHDLDALAAYARALPAPPRDPPADVAAVERGRRVFEAEAQGCASCHPGGHTDNASHDVGADPFHVAFDTPSLHGVGRGAPYFHDGRYATLDELLRGTDGHMGHTAHLGDADLHALVAYLETL